MLYYYLLDLTFENMRININKLKAVLLYFSLNTKHLGKVKLMKLIYFLDFIHLKNYGTPVTYDAYINLKHGPIPSTIKNMIDDATEDIKHSNLRDVINIETWQKKTSGEVMYKIVPNREFTENDKKYFSDTELEILGKVITRFKYSTADQIEDASHKECPWKETKYLDSISYTLAAKDPDSKVSEKEIELLLKSL